MSSLEGTFDRLGCLASSKTCQYKQLYDLIFILPTLQVYVRSEVAVRDNNARESSCESGGEGCEMALKPRSSVARCGVRSSHNFQELRVSEAR